MFPASRRATFQLSRQLRTFSRPFSVTTSAWTTEKPAVVDEARTPQTTDNAAPLDVAQAPNRQGIWSKSQKPRSEAMSGPRFEQLEFDVQVRGSTASRTPDQST